MKFFIVPLLILSVSVSETEYRLRVNTLTVDKVGGQYYNWAFSPLVKNTNHRGYAYNGSKTGADNSAWTVWVR